MELVRIFKEHNVFGWISVGTAILSAPLLNVAIISNVTFYSYQMLAVCDGRRAVRHH